MNLRKSHDRTPGFDAFLLLCAVVGFGVAAYGLTHAGFWRVLGSLALVCLALLVYGIFIEPHRLTVATYRVKLQRDPRVWIRIAFLSDLHAGGFHPKSWYERIAREVHALRPDLIALGGDYVVDRADAMQALKPLAGLQAPLGKFFVMGNHDMIDRPQEIRATLASFGYTDLSNRSTSIEREGRVFDLQGVDDHWCGRPKRFRRPSKERPHLTLSHEPDILMDLKEGDTDLVLSGHTHGGQIRLPLLGALWPIPAKLGRAVDRERKLIRGSTLIVSNGLGETDGRLRLFAPPQIVIVEVGI
jgi:hypothetical protein